MFAKSWNPATQIGGSGTGYTVDEITEHCAQVRNTGKENKMACKKKLTSFRFEIISFTGNSFVHKFNFLRILRDDMRL